ncbi:MAG: biotin/lipoyl-containing protein [Candidatus Kariarchaeaceae archaeon]|jgi:biotin carboxyl carrier protein
MDDKSKSTVTPIKLATDHQKEEHAKEAKLEKRKLKAYDVFFNGRDQVVHIDQETGEVIIDGKAYDVEVEYDEDGYYNAIVGENHPYKIEYQGGQIYLEGRAIEFSYNPAVPKLERKKSTKSGERIIVAPLPGNVTEIAVKVGDEVAAGQKVLTLEAMKMQNDIVSDGGGVVADVYVKTGDLVSTDQRLIKIVAKNEE